MPSFLLKLALSFLVGGLWVALTATLAERRGSTLGGLIGGLPSTVVVALLFIGWSQGQEQAYAATLGLPAAFGVNALFMVGYAAAAGHGLAAGLAGAVAAWTVGQGLLMRLGVSRYPVALVAWAVLLVGAYLILDRIIGQLPPMPRRPPRAGSPLVLRALLAGTVVSLAVLLSRLGGPLLGAIMAAFPAVYLSTLIITARSLGILFSRTITLPLTVSGVFNCVVFVTAFRAALPALGLLPAVLAGYLAAAVSAYLTYRFLRLREGQDLRRAESATRAQAE